MRIHPTSTPPAGKMKKDLRRLPHVYSKVLELPLRADAHVAAFESPAAFHFVAPGTGAGAAMAGGEVRARAVRIHPSVVKVVVQAAGAGDEDDDGMELDRWRSRLPEESCPAMAVAGYVDGQLIVTVPKITGEDAGEGADGAWKCCNGGEITGKLVAVQ